MRSLESIIETNKNPKRVTPSEVSSLSKVAGERRHREILREIIANGRSPVYIQSEEAPPVKSWRDLPKAQRDARMDAFERDMLPVRRS